MGPNKTAKLKIRGYPNIFIRTTQPAWQVLCLFLACSRKMVLSLSGLAKQRGIEKDILDSCFLMGIIAKMDSRLRGNDGRSGYLLKIKFGLQQ
jgi:hypothetical protein